MVKLPRSVFFRKVVLLSGFFVLIINGLFLVNRLQIQKAQKAMESSESIEEKVANLPKDASGVLRVG